MNTHYRSAKIVILLLTVSFFTMLGATGRSLAAVELTVGSVEAKAGQEIEVPISIRNAAGLEGLQFVLTFDPAGLENTGAEPGRMAGAGDINLKVREPGRVRVALLPETALDTAEGTLLTAKFRVLAQPGAELRVGIEEAKASEFRAKFPVWMQVSTTPGTIRTTASLMSMWLLIAIGAGVLVIVLILVMVKRKR